MDCSTGTCGTGYSGRKVARILIYIGAINWGLIGIGDFVDRELNIVQMLLGSMPVVESVVYVLVGLAAALELCKPCPCNKK
ncbi:DUF378 domain-containing protein [Candidatus Peribacteria bacterium]|nr:DUF378 domain-containing protein [Candidatus Peribacteria bacterium]